MKIKPCPFCDCEAEIFQFVNGGLRTIYHVECEGCHARSAAEFDKEKAIEEWNRRVYG